MKHLCITLQTQKHCKLACKHSMCMHACGHVPLFPEADAQSETGTLPGAAGELLHQWDPHLGLVPGIGTLCWALCLVTPSLFLFLQLSSRNKDWETAEISSERTRSWESVNLLHQCVANLHVTVNVTFAFGLTGALVFDRGGLSFVLFVLQILGFLPPNLQRKHTTLIEAPQLKAQTVILKAFPGLITSKAKTY